ncbi:MAG: GNAT family N-acetyltransferase [Nocardioides sp.]
MSRLPVILRDVVLTDAVALAELWIEIVRPVDGRDPVASMVAIIEGVQELPGQRLVVAEYEGVVVGAVLLRVMPLTPLHVEPILQVIAPEVLPEFRRRGIGRALMEAAATFAEEQGVTHVGTASMSNSREANRFMARLGLAPQATLRLASTQTLRAKLGGLRGGELRQPGRPLTQVLAARRSLRRAQSVAAPVD